MEFFTVTKSVEIDYGHRVPQHKSKCASVHGHRGKIEVTVCGPLIADGSSEDMVMDFSDIKLALELEITNRFDHTFVMADSDEGMRAILRGGNLMASSTSCVGRAYLIEHFGRVQEVKGMPTAENLARICFGLLSRTLNDKFRHVVSVRFWETPTSVAEYSSHNLVSGVSPDQMSMLEAL